MYHWIAIKDGLYLSDIDKDGNFVHSENEEDALKFPKIPMSLLKHGYGLRKQ